MSWKQYGGILNGEQQHNSSIGVLTANEVSITGSVINKTKFLNDLDISGNIFVSEINGNTITCKNLNIEYLNITEAVINGGILYLDLNADVFFKGQQGSIGLNKLIPSATFDISGQSTYGTPPENDNRYIYNEALNVYTMSDINKNIIARNGGCQGISVLADLSNSMINFYSDNRIPTSNNGIAGNTITYLDKNYVADAQINYTKGGILKISSPLDVDISSNLIINKKNNSKHLLNESVIIYDISGNSYLSPYYKSYNAGNALTLVSTDTSSNTFLNIISPDKKGAFIGGGQYPEDLTRKMGVIGLIDGSNSIITPAQTIVSGNILTRNYTTTGFNTLKPLIDDYVVDINGPVHIKDGEITNLINVPFEITDMNFCSGSPQNGIIVGSPYDKQMLDYSYNIFYTTNSGLKWNSANLNLENIKNIGYIPQGIFLYSVYQSIISGTQGIILYSTNGGLNYNQFTHNTGFLDASFNLTKNYIVSYNPPNQRIFVGNNDTTIGSILYFDISFSSLNSSIISTPSVVLNNINNVNGNQSIKCPINACDGSGNNLITVGYTGTSAILFYYNNLGSFEINNQGETYNHTYSDLSQSYRYNNIKVLDTNIAVAVGNNIISYSLNYSGGATTWVDISFSNVIFHSVSIYNAECGMASGENVIYYSSNGFQNWFPVSYDLINSSGKGADFLNSKNYQNIYIKDISNFIVSNIRKKYNYDSSNNIFTQGNSIVNNLYFPNLLNYLNSSVLDISGSITISGGINFKSDLIAKNVSLNMVNGGYIYQF
jgi:hypothetical protein